MISGEVIEEVENESDESEIHRSILSPQEGIEQENLDRMNTMVTSVEKRSSSFKKITTRFETPAGSLNRKRSPKVQAARFLRSSETGIAKIMQSMKCAEILSISEQALLKMASFKSNKKLPNNPLPSSKGSQEKLGDLERVLSSKSADKPNLWRPSFQRLRRAGSMTDPYVSGQKQGKRKQNCSLDSRVEEVEV